MVKREVDVPIETWKTEDSKEEHERNAPLFRNRRSVRTYHDYGESQLSPLSVAYATNYNKEQNKGWVKPLFSSIVYRLPVSNGECDLVRNIPERYFSLIKKS